ncbi:hypothetical protein C3F09_05015 [candidate division GN15 bacterium]|uniref:Dockerin domain-containing protein n=1 Tax=candidate division GN15 bacterium TaxID=2072418 RepID=A0A855X215_9BACT|nr:MAG: hypothetical protein C3F09_05015 [candidate division GN15 bacterium]
MVLSLSGAVRLAACFFVSVLIPYCSWASGPSLILRVDDITVPVTNPSVSLRLGIINPRDHIAGYELRLLLNRPDLAVFTGDFDTTSSVIGGWEYVWAEIQDGGSRLHLVGLAEMTPPYNHPPVYPCDTERTLLHVALHINPVPDTLAARTGYVQIDTSLEYFGLANYLGELIGLKADTTFDTLYYRCIQSDDTGCVLWQQVWTEPYDRLYVDTTLYPYLDTSYFQLSPGRITVLPNCTPIQSPGDVNLDGVASSDDVTTLQAFVDGLIPEVPSAHNGDLNGDSCISATDVAMLARYLEFGPDSVNIAACAIPNPPRCCCVGKRGNVSADTRDMVDLADLSFLVAHLTGVGAVPVCPKEADWNGSGVVDLSDLSGLVSYLTGLGAQPAACP